MNMYKNTYIPPELFVVHQRTCDVECLAYSHCRCCRYRLPCKPRLQRDFNAGLCTTWYRRDLNAFFSRVLRLENLTFVNCVHAYHRFITFVFALVRSRYYLDSSIADATSDVSYTVTSTLVATDYARVATHDRGLFFGRKEVCNREYENQAISREFIFVSSQRAHRPSTRFTMSEAGK